ncbi:HBL/NHE enterotoxin family protein [Microcystis aeruginosa]|uniref:HBL/NHE enterotoxin family protein n=1 Tax=Microcystis aeruginosa TaxID=1126 RepID=UPI003B52CF9E
MPTALPEGSTQAQWMTDLTAIQTQSQQYQNAAKSVVTSIQTLHDNLTNDTASFAKTVSELNATVSGDGGVLDSLKGQTEVLNEWSFISICGKSDGC